MATLERGAHEADNVYAFDPNEEDDADVETSRLPLLIAIALVVLAAFAGVVWLAYTQGVEEGRADAPRSAAGQIRNAPSKSAANPYAGLNIYQPPVSSDAGNAPIAPAAPSTNGDTGNDAAVLPLRPSAGAAPDRMAPPTQTAPTAPKPAPLPKHAATAAAAPAKPLVPPPAPSSAAPSPQTSSAPAPVAVPPPAVAAPTAPQTAAGGVVLQIGSYKSDAEARASWSAFKAHHAIAAAYDPDVKEVDLGDKGVWYRLRIGAFDDRRAAAAFCEKLKAQGASCIVSR